VVLILALNMHAFWCILGGIFLQFSYLFYTQNRCNLVPLLIFFLKFSIQKGPGSFSCIAELICDTAWKSWSTGWSIDGWSGAVYCGWSTRKASRSGWYMQKSVELADYSRLVVTLNQRDYTARHIRGALSNPFALNRWSKTKSRDSS